MRLHVVLTDYNQSFLQGRLLIVLHRFLVGNPEKDLLILFYFFL